MAHTLKNMSDGDIVRLCSFEFHNALTFLKTIDRQYDARFNGSNGKNDGQILIRRPNQFSVNTGAVLDLQDVTEETVTLTVGTQKHIDLALSSAEETLSADMVQENWIRPAMRSLAAQVEYDVLSNVYQDVFNFTGTAATTPASLAAITNANARLTQNLAPRENRYVLMDPLAMAGVTGSISAYFHKANEVERAFNSALVGHASNMDWLESTMVPSHTCGTRDDTTPVCNTSTGITSGSASIVTTGFDNAATITVGDIITIADVYAVNLETKDRLSHLQQFVVTAAITCDGTDTLTVSPTPVTSGAKQNVSLVSAGANKAITATVAGAASTSTPQNMAYHKDAFTCAFADLTTPKSGKCSKINIEGIPMRYWRSSDIVNDRHIDRIDVYYGYLTQMPEWAVRVRG